MTFRLHLAEFNFFDPIHQYKHHCKQRDDCLDFLLVDEITTFRFDIRVYIHTHCSDTTGLTEFESPFSEEIYVIL